MKDLGVGSTPLGVANAPDRLGPPRTPRSPHPHQRQPVHLFLPSAEDAGPCKDVGPTRNEAQPGTVRGRRAATKRGPRRRHCRLTVAPVLGPRPRPRRAEASWTGVGGSLLLTVFFTTMPLYEGLGSGGEKTAVVIDLGEAFTK